MCFSSSSDSSSSIKASIVLVAEPTTPSSAIRTCKYEIGRTYVPALRGFSPGYASRVINFLGYMTK